MVSIDSIMHKPVITAAPDQTVAATAQQMHQAGIGAVVVVDDDRVAGIFTERDLVSLVASGGAPESTRLADVATRDVATVEVSAPLRACADILKDRGIRHVPIVDGGRAIGILSARDFFGAAAEGFERYIERARFDEQLRNDVDPYDHMGGSYGR